MRNYRRAFFLTAAGNLILLGLLLGAWWHLRGSHSTQQAARSVANGVTQSSQPSAPSSSATPPPETPLAPVQISAERLQSIGVKFGVVKKEQVEDEIRTTGTVAIDETRQSYVQTRFSGFIQKVFVDATYKYVQKGQPLFTIYSPELAAAEREYLIARQNAQNLSQSPLPGVTAGSASLVNASLDRLKQWNLPQREIERLEASGQVQEALEVDSPASGYVTERNALPNLTVQPDTRLYTIADLSTVWVFAQVFQNDLGRIRVGAPTALTVNSYPGRVFQGRVDFIYPDVDVNTRTARVRIVFSNPNLTLTPGMFVNVTVKVPLGNQLVIPVSGVLQSGTRQIVFVDKGGGYLEPRDVQLGTQAGDDYIVLEGLKAGEQIVTSANFLIDSESQLQAAIGSFTPPPPGAGAAAAMNAPGAQPAARIEFTTEPSTPRKGTDLYRVKLTGADGTPMKGAQVSVRSYVPAMPQMGMAAINVVTRLNEKGGGVYEGQATLESGGTWQITITATKNGAVIAARQLSVNAEGGM
ncbi:MAG TPA: efflux RND transporter periplasmic adaptor subunit [Candidatus Acidoferrales bacterium]|nr:efflux RND transporter periplasmic adaptor subunit [Candidatus Acidoferrales bacterium]